MTGTYIQELEPIIEKFEGERMGYKDSTYEIVSKVAYLIGVPTRIFENTHESPKMEVYQQMDKDRSARIIRHLCIIRTAIERSYGYISDKMRWEHISIFSMPEYIPQESLNQLSMDGINFVKKSSTKLNHHTIEINRLISDRINNCKNLFPLWLNWQYIRDIFVMPNGLTEAGIKAAASTYYEYKSCYPYQVYMNWKPQDEGNILYCDKKFVSLLYQWHNDYFTELSKVSDAGSVVKGNIYDFIEDSQRVVMVVDCENSDPYRLCAVLTGLDSDITAKIQKIILFDDIHTASAWRILESYTDIPVEHDMIQRVKQDKSLVDIKLTAATTREHYRNNVDAFVIVSSDSDYWGLITSLPEARFMVMVEREKCGPDIKAAMANNGIFYCYINDFYSGNSQELQRKALFQAINRYLGDAVHFNAREMYEEALRTTRANLTPAERSQFYDKHIRQMYLVIDEDGKVSVELKR